MSMLINWYKFLNHFHFSRAKLVESVLSLVNYGLVRFYLIFLVILNLANWFLAFYVNRNVSQELVVLHYNVNLGVNLIGSVADLYAIPILGMAFILINFSLLLNLY